MNDCRKINPDQGMESTVYSCKVLDGQSLDFHDAKEQKNVNASSTLLEI